MATFRFIHTADVHIDSPMVGLSQHAGETVARIRSATRKAFSALIDKAPMRGERRQKPHLNGRFRAIQLAGSLAASGR